MTTSSEICHYCKKTITYQGNTPINPDLSPHHCGSTRTTCEDCGKPIDIRFSRLNGRLDQFNPYSNTLHRCL